MSELKVLVKPFFLEFKRPFALSHGTRKGTNTVFIRLEYEGVYGYGEACLPPYLKYTVEQVVDYLNGLDLKKFDPLKGTLENLNLLSLVIDKCGPARAALSSALWDLESKRLQKNIKDLIGIIEDTPVKYCFTVSAGDADELEQVISEQQGFELLKVKVGSGSDLEFIDSVRRFSTKPVCVDVNQGWTNKLVALDSLKRMVEMNVLFVEQPFPVNMEGEMQWLKENSPISIYGDESIQGPEDVDKFANSFHGINIKFMKCGGIDKAVEMIKIARKMDMGVMVGSMSESSCGIMASSHIASMCQYADLDGPLLIKNDPFKGAVYRNGKLMPVDGAGIGAEPVEGLF